METTADLNQYKNIFSETVKKIEEATKERMTELAMTDLAALIWSSIPKGKVRRYFHDWIFEEYTLVV